jgi:hypothetical protein
MTFFTHFLGTSWTLPRSRSEREGDSAGAWRGIEVKSRAGQGAAFTF